MVFTLGHVDNELNCSIEHFRHEHEGDRNAKGDKCYALKFKIHPGQKRGDPAKKDNTHVAVVNKKIPQAFERDYQAFPETMELENPAKKSFSSHGYLKIINSIKIISSIDRI